jgi:hypothetical protein
VAISGMAASFANLHHTQAIPLRQYQWQGHAWCCSNNSSHDLSICMMRSLWCCADHACRRFLSGLVINVFTPALLFSKLGTSGGTYRSSCMYTNNIVVFFVLSIPS